MNNFQIETAQNVSIVNQAAGIGERLLAYFVDLCIYFFIAIVLVIALSALDLEPSEEWVYMLVVGLPLFLYHVLFEIFWNGKTPGKALVGLQVVRLDGSNASVSNYLIRWLLSFIDITFTGGSVAILTIVFNGKGQRLGDIAAKTTVISKRNDKSFRDVLHIEVPQDYKPTYPQVTVFTDAEIQKIKNIYTKAKQRGQHHIILRLSLQITKVTNIKTEQKPIHFIDTVIKDYNYYTQQ